MKIVKYIFYITLLVQISINVSAESKWITKKEIPLTDKKGKYQIEEILFTSLKQLPDSDFYFYAVDEENKVLIGYANQDPKSKTLTIDNRKFKKGNIGKGFFLLNSGQTEKERVNCDIYSVVEEIKSLRVYTGKVTMSCSDKEKYVGNWIQNQNKGRGQAIAESGKNSLKFEFTMDKTTDEDLLFNLFMDTMVLYPKKTLEDTQSEQAIKITTNEKYYALIIGNNNYQYLEKLEAAENDARVMADILKNNYGFEVKLLLNANYDTTVDSIHKISKKLTKDDNLLIFYAGHGELDKKQNRGYWLPVDASYEKRSKWISNAILVDEFKATDAKHVLLIVDSCFSGSLMRSASQTSTYKELVDEKYIRKLQKKKTRLVIASGGNEPVMDNDGGDHSLFAQKLISTLKENKGVINTELLFKNIRQYVSNNSDQMPEIGAIYKAGHDGGDFLFFSNIK